MNTTLETLKKALKVLQRDPDITNTAFGEDELEEQLRIESMTKRREDEMSRQRRPPGSAGNDSSNSSFREGPPRDGMMGGPQGGGMG